MLATAGASVLVFFALVVGGGIYRVSCVTETRPSLSWRVKGDIPYLWSAGGSCASHTLTRFVIGKIGLMADVSHATAAQAQANLAQSMASQYHLDLVRAIGVSSTQFRSDLTSGRFVPPGAPGFSASDGQATQAILRGDVHAATLHQLRSILVVLMVGSRRSSQNVRLLAGPDRGLEADWSASAYLTTVATRMMMVSVTRRVRW